MGMDAYGNGESKSRVEGAVRNRPINQRCLVRLGGMAGIVAGLSFILAAMALLGGSASSDPKDMIQEFPEGKVLMAIGDILYLVTVISLIFLIIVLYQILRRQNTYSASVGSCIALIGLAALAVGSLPYVAYSKISDTYHSPTISPEDQTSLVYVWQAVQGIFNEIDTVGFMLLAVGIIILSVSMARSPMFGRRFGACVAILGVSVLFGMSLFTVDSDAIFPFVLVAFIVLPFIFGWKLIRLSKRMEPGAFE